MYPAHTGLYQVSDAEQIPVAIKTVKEESSVDTQSQFEREIEIMATFNHPNIVKFIGVVIRGEFWPPSLNIIYHNHPGLPPEKYMLTLMPFEASHVCMGFIIISAMNPKHDEVKKWNDVVVEGPCAASRRR